MCVVNRLDQREVRNVCEFHSLLFLSSYLLLIGGSDSRTSTSVRLQLDNIVVAFLPPSTHGGTDGRSPLITNSLLCRSLFLLLSCRFICVGGGGDLLPKKRKKCWWGKCPVPRGKKVLNKMEKCREQNGENHKKCNVSSLAKCVEKSWGALPQNWSKMLKIGGALNRSRMLCQRATVLCAVLQNGQKVGL